MPPRPGAEYPAPVVAAPVVGSEPTPGIEPPAPPKRPAGRTAPAPVGAPAPRDGLGKATHCPASIVCPEGHGVWDDGLWDAVNFEALVPALAVVAFEGLLPVIPVATLPPETEAAPAFAELLLLALVVVVVFGRVKTLV